MRNRRAINALQNAALVLLTLSALFLLTRLPLFQGSWADSVQSLLSPHPADGDQTPAGSLGEMFPAVHVMVTGDSEYGRYGQLCLAPDDSLLQQAVPLFQEALGSASEVGITADATLREALDSPCLYLDLTCQLPLEAAAAWLGEDAAFDRDVRGMALTTEEADTAVLYLRSETGEIYRYYTALPVSAVQGLCALFPSNDSCFAYETSYASLAPYTVLTAQARTAPDLQAELPAGYSAYNLLSSLDFNAHTLSRYTETATGAEVVEESPRSLRIGPDGTVSFTSRGEAASSLYRASSGAEAATAVEALAAAWRLAAALTDGTGASELCLQGLETEEDGYTVRFRYQADGIPVSFADETDALRVTVSGSSITAFTYRCRAYTALEESSSPLLPPAMARALAALRPGAELSLGYVDDGAGLLSAGWLAG